MGTKSQVTGVFAFLEDKRTLAASVVLAVISVFGGLIPYYAAAHLVTGIVGARLGFGEAFLWGFAALAGFIVKAVFFGASSAVSHKMAYEVIARIRVALADKLLRIPAGEAEKRTSGQYKAIIMDEVDHLEYPLAHMAPELTSHILGFLVVLGCILFQSWQLALASLGSLVLGLAIYALMMVGRDVMGMFRKYTEESETMAGVMVEYVSGMEVIKAFGRTASSMDRFSSSVRGFCGSMTAWFKHCHPFLAGFYVVTPNCLMFVLPVGALLMMAGAVSLDAFVLCMFLSLGVAQPLIKVMEFADHIMAIDTTMGKVNQILDAEELPQGRLPLGDADSIEARNVSFGYGEVEVLHDVSFRVGRGQKAAFVGASGSGKSTIAKLLVRFYDPEDGCVLVDGVDIRNAPLGDLMDKVSFVTQDNFLFNVSVIDNILVGNPHASKGDAIRAAVRAGCHEFILELPNGYETRVGDAGGRLSGGQRQRIAIARAILKDAPIVILDEASAYMDPENEERVQRSIESMAKGKTLIMIAHRLNTVVNCDVIFVVEGGRIVGEGTHEELLEGCSAYRELWRHVEGETLS